MFVTAGLFGLADSAVAVLAYTVLGRTCNAPSAAARAGAVRQLIYSVGFLVGFGLGPALPAQTQLLIIATLGLTAWVALATE